VAVVGILAAIAYPSYVDSVRKARRSDGTAALMNAAQKMEAYYARNASYANATLANTNIPASSEEGYYNISINTVTTNSYILRATATGNQADDDIKGFQLDSTGARTHSTDGSNWNTVGWNE